MGRNIFFKDGLSEDEVLRLFAGVQYCTQTQIGQRDLAEAIGLAEREGDQVRTVGINGAAIEVGIACVDGKYNITVSPFGDNQYRKRVEEVLEIAA